MIYIDLPWNLYNHNETMQRFFDNIDDDNLFDLKYLKPNEDMVSWLNENDISYEFVTSKPVKTMCGKDGLLHDYFIKLDIKEDAMGFILRWI